MVYQVVALKGYMKRGINLNLNLNSKSAEFPYGLLE